MKLTTALATSLLVSHAVAVRSVHAGEPVEEPATVAAAAPASCTGAERRQFDFWIGEWEVRSPDGKVAGHNRIERILDGCVLMENWRSSNGKSVGHSFNLWSGGKWHQTWVDNQGLLLELVGGVDAKGRMVMSQDTKSRDGKPLRHEIAWTKISADEVKQHWRTSSDAGKTWKDAFVGTYLRAKKEKAAEKSKAETP